MEPTLSDISSTVARAESLEDLTRPLLEMLCTVTGLESSYLTTIDADAGWQHVLFARNTGRLNVAEGLYVQWHDTLCRRSLAEGCPYVEDASRQWADSEAARALGIRAYVSTPVCAKDGTVLGTLCGASAEPRQLPEAARSLLQLFSRLLGIWIERERLVQQLEDANARISSLALMDTLTGLPNRRAILDGLARMLASARRDRSTVLVGVVDLDGFKRINDTYGHPVGDLFLRHAAARIRSALREADCLGRLGGDEFALYGHGPAGGPDAAAAARLLQDRIGAATAGVFESDQATFDYAGASAGVVAVDARALDAEEALRLADAGMYEVKRLRAADRARAAAPENVRPG